MQGNLYSTVHACVCIPVAKVVTITVRGKILEGKNFGKSMPLKLLTKKILVNLPVVNRKNLTHELVSSVNQHLRLGLHPCA